MNWRKTDHAREDLEHLQPWNPFPERDRSRNKSHLWRPQSLRKVAGLVNSIVLRYKRYTSHGSTVCGWQAIGRCAQGGDAETIPEFYFDPSTLAEWGSRLNRQFSESEPFEHVVIDDFLPAEIIDLLANEIPPTDSDAWVSWKRGKLEISDENGMGPFTRHFMAQLNSQTFLSFLESLTGFEPLIPDVYYNSYGLHSTQRGGRLIVHVDSNRYPVEDFEVHERHNLILFLNPDWKEEYGGHLEFWNDDTTRCVKKVTPVLNRCVIFHTTTHSFHGHPVPLNCPEGRRRNSLAAYYYTPARQPDADYDGMRDFVEWRVTGRGERAFVLNRKFRYFIKQFVPPILQNAIDHLQKGASDRAPKISK